MHDEDGYVLASGELDDHVLRAHQGIDNQASYICDVAEEYGVELVPKC